MPQLTAHSRHHAPELMRDHSNLLEEGTEMLTVPLDGTTEGTSLSMDAGGSLIFSGSTASPVLRPRTGTDRAGSFSVQL